MEQPFGWARAGHNVEAAGEGVESPTALGMEALEDACEGGDRRLCRRVGARNGQVLDELAVGGEVVAAEGLGDTAEDEIGDGSIENAEKEPGVGAFRDEKAPDVHIVEADATGLIVGCNKAVHNAGQDKFAAVLLIEVFAIDIAVPMIIQDRTGFCAVRRDFDLPSFQFAPEVRQVRPCLRVIASHRRFGDETHCSRLVWRIGE